VCAGSGFDQVVALPVLALGGHDRQLHLLANSSRDEPPDRMRLPTTRLLQLLGRCPARPLEQIEDLGGLAAATGAGGFRRALGRFLGRAGLLPRLALFRRDVGATCASGGLFRGFLRRGSGGRAVTVDSGVDVMMFLLWAVITASHPSLWLAANASEICG
jgi:hypothetical protein